MKKLFVSLLAIAGLVACTNDEVVNVQSSNAIAFDTFVENSTRANDPSITKATLKAFDVWAYVDEKNGTVLTEERVSRQGDTNVWSYVNTQYWTPDHTYYFTAIAPVDTDNYTNHWDYSQANDTIEFTNVNGTEDLIYAATSESTHGKELGESMDKVKFQFDHLLSKVGFTFKNEFTTSNVHFEVVDVKMVVPAEATYAVANEGAWTINGTETTTLAFGNVEDMKKQETKSAANERFTIPAAADKSYKVTFTINHYNGDVLVKEYVKESTITGVEFEKGKAYNFVAGISPENLNLKAIEFTVEGVDGWEEKTVSLIDSPAKLVEAIEGDEVDHIILDGDINLDDLFSTGTLSTRAGSSSASITIPADKEVVLDLKDFTITGTDNDTASFGMFNIQPGAKLTIEGGNGKIQLTATKNRGWNAFSSVISNQRGEFVLNGGTIQHLGGTDMAYGIDNLTNTGAGDAKTTINGGVVESTYRAVRLFLNSTKALDEVIVNGGTIKGANKSIWVQNANSNVNPGKLVVAENANLYGDVMVSGENAPELAIELSVAEAALKDDATVIPSKIPAGYDIYVKNGNWVVEKVVVVDGNEVAIYNTAGLKWIAQQVDGGDTFADKTIKLLEDIDLTTSDNWDPIGDNREGQYAAFSGTFDGNNKTITGAHITGDDCFNGAVYGSKEGWGLFSVLDGATVKNLKVDGATFASYTVISGTIAGYTNNTTFENIDITNTKIAGYNWYTGGVVGWAQGECTFKGINLDDTVSVGTLWDSHGQNAGGIAGGVSSSAKITIEDCNIACVMDVINDITSNYKWCLYRVSGMIIGNTNTTETKYNEVVTATATNVTCNNVTVTYGDWMNYHYCEGYWNRGWGRYESSDYVGGVDQNEPHNHADGESHHVCIPFDQLFGGSSNGSGHYPVKGLAEFPGVTVNYPESFFREQGYKAEGDKYTVYSGDGFKHVATNVLNDGTKNVTIELANDIDLAGIEWPAVSTKAAFVLDGKGYAIKNLTTSAVEDHGFYSTAMFTSTRKAATIKNLVVENATVTGKGGDNSHGAVLVACNYAALNIEGVTVKNSTVSNCDRSSVIATYLYFTTATVNNCVVEGCTVNSIGTAGALLGMNNSHNFEATGNTVKNTTISSSEGSNKAGILIGTWQNAGTLTESNNVVENSKAINAGTETNNNIGRHA